VWGQAQASDARKRIRRGQRHARARDERLSMRVLQVLAYRQITESKVAHCGIGSDWASSGAPQGKACLTPSLMRSAKS
jgi:hypothetical protein